MLSTTKSDILISVVIVNFKVPEYLKETIRSLREAQLYENTEIIVVDNDSRDNSQQLVTSDYPEVHWIQMKNNVGFGKACNIGVKKASGTYILLLNPDTVITKNTLTASVDFMRAHPEVGLMGPKILNPDGSLQASCRRSFPSPADAMFHFSGLSTLFPENKFFGKYNLTYLDQDTSTQVDAVSGSCMFLSRALFTQIGGFDERFFMYGEDLDICWRIKDAGFKVWYFPGTQIIHRKGKSSGKIKFKSRIAFYEAMVIFSKKYKNRSKGFFPGWFIYFGIFIQAAINIGINLVSYSTSAILGLLIINVTLWVGISLRFSAMESPYTSSSPTTILLIHALISSCFMFMFAYNGVYVKKRYSILNTFLSSCMASVLFIALLFFFKSMAFSRIAFAISSVAISFILVSWRELFPRVIHHFKQLLYSPNNIVIVGSGSISKSIIHNIEAQNSGKIIGILWSDTSKKPGEYEGYPVLAEFSDLKRVIKNHKIDMLIIATSFPWYSLIIDTLSSLRVRNLNIQWVPHEFFSLPEDKVPTQIQLRTFSV